MNTHIKKGENPVVTPGPDSYREKTKVWQKQCFMSYGAVKRECFCAGWRETAYSRKEQISKKENKTKKRNVTDKTLNGFNNQNSCTIYLLHFKNIFIHIFFFFFSFRHTLYDRLCNTVTRNTTKVTRWNGFEDMRSKTGGCDVLTD